MNEIFFTADLHLAHFNVALHCRRMPWIVPNPNFDPSKPIHFKFNNPETVNLESMNRDLINNWNSVVGKKDIIYILGDLCWKNHSHYIMALNGSKYLIRGNHDKMDQNALKLFAQIGGAHYQFSYYTQIHGRRVMLSHCPYETWFSSCHGSWHLHGHCHGRLPERVELLRFDIGVDSWGFYPVPWDVIEAKMIEKEKARKEYFLSKGKSLREDENEEDDDSDTGESKRVETSAGESLNNFFQVRDKNIEIMKKFGVIKDG